jgi:hypothetical protein
VVSTRLGEAPLIPRLTFHSFHLSSIFLAWGICLCRIGHRDHGAVECESRDWPQGGDCVWREGSASTVLLEPK